MKLFKIIKKKITTKKKPKMNKHDEKLLEDFRNGNFIDLREKK